jgi:hypothetical protein
MTVAVVDKRHRPKMQLRRTIRKPVCLIEVYDTIINVIGHFRTLISLKRCAHQVKTIN